ncbi:MAG: hypothetical protein PHX68_03385 [Alphaproteobacteria bacterium]|nr:hypothetical protein [Alphaproteobacteria bacterium]
MREVILLAGSIWVVAIGFIVFAWLLMCRSHAVLSELRRRLRAVEQKTDALVRIEQKSIKKTISIDTSEAIGPYRSAALPDEASVDFVDAGTK